MVNNEVYNYLNNYNDKFPLEALKKKCLEAGYSKKDVEEVASQLTKSKKINLQKKEKKIQNNNNNNQSNNPSSNYSGFMKFSGICVIFGILLFFVTIGLSFVETSESVNFSLSVLSFLIFIPILIGFYKIAKKHKNPLLKVMVIISLFLFVLFLLFTVFSFFSSQIIGEDILSNSDLESFDSLASLTGTILLIFVLFLVLLFFMFITGILFSIGLIKLPGEVKFAKTIGIMLLIGFITLPILIGLIFLFIVDVLMIPMFFSEAKKN
jgi:uncharacterized membrane protein